MAREEQVFIDPRLCRICRRCYPLETCEDHAILRNSREEGPYVDPARCVDCRLCRRCCPFDAVQLSKTAK